MKPLNIYGGGMAVTNDAALAGRIAQSAATGSDPSDAGVLHRLRVDQAQRIMIRPRVFSATLFPLLWAASWTRATPDVYLWESIRPLVPMPPSYVERYSNAQAALGIEGLSLLDDWIAATRAHAATLSRALSGLDGVKVPHVLGDRTHVFYQYAIYARNRDAGVRRCLRNGVDVETLHVDVCTSLDLFRQPLPQEHAPSPGAVAAAEAIQLPVYASLGDADLARVVAVVTAAVRAG